VLVIKSTPQNLAIKLSIPFYVIKTTEPRLLQLYTKLYIKQCAPIAFKNSVPKNMFASSLNNKVLRNKKKFLARKKRGYLKRMVRLRYRWQYRPELENFRRFRKFFRRVFKRFRKIQKNRLFITHFRRNLSKMSGFSERFILKKWLLFKRNYNQYWAATNSVAKFGQTLTMSPYAFLVSLKIAPSLLASKYLIECGSVSVNGKIASVFTSVGPGDIFQINMKAVVNSRSIINYQKWQNFTSYNKKFPFIQADWSSLLFLIIKWPGQHELIAPKFLSERWLRYYIRQFPTRIRKYSAVKFNTHIYKKTISRNIGEDVL